MTVYCLTNIQKDCIDACITTVVAVDRTTTESLSARPDVERYIYSPYMTEKAPPIVEIDGPEDFPGEDLPFDVVAVALGFDCDTDSTLIFDDSAKAVAYLNNRGLNSDRPEASQELLRLVSEVDTSEKRIIVLNFESVSWTDYFSNLRQLEKLSLNGGKLGMLYANNDSLDVVKDDAMACITTVVTVDRTAAESLSAKPDVERYIYKAIK